MCVCEESNCALHYAMISHRTAAAVAERRLARVLFLHSPGFWPHKMCKLLSVCSQGTLLGVALLRVYVYMVVDQTGYRWTSYTIPTLLAS